MTRIVDFDAWYTTTVGLKGNQVVDLWAEEERRALADGCSGLRITGNTSFLNVGQWTTFMEYERSVTEGFRGRRIIALCSYSLENCNPKQAAEVREAHDCAFERPDSNWQVISSPLA